MKKIFLFIFLASIGFTHGQELPTIPANGFSFSLGTKFSIKLVAIDSINFDYSVIEFEKFDSIIDTYDNDSLFKVPGRDSTITFYFCLGTYGESKSERKHNMQVLLIMKNYSKIALSYSSDIQREQDGEYESTSNVGSFPGATGMEMWPYKIYMIGLRGFKRYK